MNQTEKTPRQLITLKREGSPDKKKPCLTVSVNIPDTATENQAAMIYGLFQKHFPKA